MRERDSWCVFSSSLWLLFGFRTETRSSVASTSAPRGVSRARIGPSSLLYPVPCDQLERDDVIQRIWLRVTPTRPATHVVRSPFGTGIRERASPSSHHCQPDPVSSENLRHSFVNHNAERNERKQLNHDRKLEKITVPEVDTNEVSY